MSVTSKTNNEFCDSFYTVLKGYFLNIEEVTFQIPKDI